MAAKTIKLSPVKKATLTQTTIEKLIKLVKAGSLKPGDKLPSEAKLGTQLDVSRSAIREALQSLAAMGVIEIQNGRGSFVRSIAPDLLIRSDVLEALLETQTLLHVLETRGLLEIGIAGLAAERATGEDFQVMEQTLSALRLASERGDKNAVARIAWNFHVSIARATHNEVLINLLESFSNLLRKVHRELQRAIPDYSRHEYMSHNSLYRAVCSKSKETARREMVRHLRLTERIIRASGAKGTEMQTQAIRDFYCGMKPVAEPVVLHPVS